MVNQFPLDLYMLHKLIRNFFLSNRIIHK